MDLKEVINLDDFRQLAKRKLPRIAFDFIDGGSDDDLCLLRNRKAFQSYQLLPRYLLNVAQRSQSVDLFGSRYDSPIGISPTGMGGLFRLGADAMLASAAKALNVPYLLSSASNLALEDAVKIAPHNVWFQMYATSDQRINSDLVKRAIDSGVKALVLTVDVPVNANRERNRRNGFSRPFRLTRSVVLDAITHPAWLFRYLQVGGLPMLKNWQPYAPDGASADDVADLYGTLTPAPRTTWDLLARIRETWKKPLIVKGILHPDDATQAADHGIDGVIVSNHGGRQLDSAPSPVRMLPLIASAVGHRMTVMLDSGIRRGSDLVIGRCLGAQAGFFGRPTLYAVAAAGQAGAEHALGLIRREVDAVMAQIGVTAFEDLSHHYLLPEQGVIESKF
ncbi:MAG: alpha-hydroxy acid oxidase [Orrella sp.]|jgi:(S)-mandelate dehydrogenase|uniref:alpha-hydroxy acid oxidase n=1 Tax=Orrella sp. TaxID=1921583 RepID=UPI0027636908|nr:alpha-hydroxy-acid oxidizing protein [Burkholderiales bacterium]